MVRRGLAADRLSLKEFHLSRTPSAPLLFLKGFAYSSNRTARIVPFIRPGN
jgi:hypothetical protein